MQNLIKFIAKSNRTRKKHITEMIMRKNPETVGVCRLIYEPTLKAEQFNNCKVINNFEDFSKKSDVILANRLEEELKVVKNKIYTSDLYSRD